MNQLILLTALVKYHPVQITDTTNHHSCPVSSFLLFIFDYFFLIMYYLVHIIITSHKRNQIYRTCFYTSRFYLNINKIVTMIQLRCVLALIIIPTQIENIHFNSNQIYMYSRSKTNG